MAILSTGTRAPDSMLHSTPDQPVPLSGLRGPTRASKRPSQNRFV